MKKPVIAIVVILMLCFSSVTHAQTSYDEKYNISELMNTASQNFDMQIQDAVFLLDSKDVSWLPDGRLSTTIHQIIWLNTEVAVEEYGDHRIPYDSAHEAFIVKTLRTWRDNEWWRTGPTGIVETLPYQMRNAYDYSNIREMMLLHNGIEIPCIIEYAYTIEDIEPYRNNIDGVHSLQGEHATVKSVLTIETPDSITPTFYSSISSQSKVKNYDVALGLDSYQWELGPLDALPRPLTEESGFDGPYVAWSTWSGWSSIGGFIDQTFTPALKLDSTLEKAVDSLKNKARNTDELADLIAAYVNDNVATIQYQEDSWYSFPRTASRTFETSYANPVDKCILAEAMFSKASLHPEFMFWSKGMAMHDMSTPTFGYLSGIGIYLDREYCPAYYDPSEGIITRTNTAYYRKAYFLTGDNSGKGLVPVAGASMSVLNINIKVTAGDSTFEGSGYCKSSGCFSVFNNVSGLGDQAKDYVGGLASSILENAEYKNFNPAALDCEQTEFGFEFGLKKPKPDVLGRMKISLGEPSGGIMDKLPDDVHLYEDSRGSWIYLHDSMIQNVTLEFDLTGMDLVYRPADQKIENNVGRFFIQSKNENNKLIISKGLAINMNKIAPEDWPKLREMLLQETGERNNLLIIKAVDSKNKRE